MTASFRLILLFSLVSLAAVVGYKENGKNLRRRLSWDSILRPVMHTFFAELVPALGSGGRTAGMTSNAHSNMLSAWKDSWQEAGWQTHVLTMEDAKKHPEFEQLDALIGNFTMTDYDKACYYRWIAMAAVGGGWMSDYDTLPLNNFTDDGFNLPNQGAFTDYEGPVPSLLSGSANEWLRMIRRLVEHASTHMMVSGFTPSDMFSLVALRENYANIYISRQDVVSGPALTDGDTWTVEVCREKTPSHARAMHFSHAMIARKWLPNHPDDTLEDRPEIARKWIEGWQKNCGRQQLTES